MDYLTKVNEWKNSQALTQKEKDELNNMSEEMLKEAFYTNLSF